MRELLLKFLHLVVQYHLGDLFEDTDDMRLFILLVFKINLILSFIP